MKIKTLLYCCKDKPYLYFAQEPRTLMEIDNSFEGYKITNKNVNDYLNGKIACECEVDTEEIIAHEYRDYYSTSINHIGDVELKRRSCLELYQLIDYLGVKELGSYGFVKKVGYALHLSNVKERVMDLSKCYTKKIIRDKVLGSPYGDLDSVAYHFEKREVLVPITKAPQNMMWGWIKENGEWVRYLIISVRPQWLCKILNGEKDIEVRRKVLKGMVD